MKIRHLAVAALWVFAVTVEAQTQCYDSGRTIICQGDEPAHLLRSPDGLGISGWKEGRPYSYRLRAPDGLRPLPKLRQFPESRYGYQGYSPGYWQY